MTPKKSYQSGFSLVEIIVVTAVAGMIIIVLANLPATIGLITSGSRESIAKEIAAKKMSDLRSVGYTNLSFGTNTITDARLNSLPSSSGNALVEACPSSICPGGTEEVKKVTVTINWKENNKDKDFKLVTLIAQGGLK